MISTNWLRRRKEHWERLRLLLDQVEHSRLQRLSRDQLRELGLLYRQSAADLAVIRTDPSAANLANSLNQLLARAHNTIYTGQRVSGLAIVRLYAKTYPGVLRRNLRLCAIATAIFAVSAVAGALLTFRDPQFELSVLGPHMVETIERHQMWTHSIVGIKPLASSAIMTNNLSVAFTTFAAGITGGLGTIYMMVFNGLLIGVIGTACWLAGMSKDLWSFVAPHGVLEIPAILIAGGAGLRLAEGLLFPGYLPRKAALEKAGGEAVRLLLGVVPMLILAGVIEGFFSPSAVSVVLKFAFAAALLILFLIYLSWSNAADHS